MATAWNDLVDTTIANYDRLCGDFIAKMPDVGLDSRIAIATGIEFSRLAAADASGTWLSTPKKVFAFMQHVRNEYDELFDEIIENVPEDMAGDVDLIDLDEVDKKNLKSVPPAVLAQWAEAMLAGLAQSVADDMEVQEYVGDRFAEDVDDGYGPEQLTQAFLALCQHSPHPEQTDTLLGALRFGNGGKIMDQAMAMMDGMEQPEERRWADAKATPSIQPYIVNAVWCAYNWTEHTLDGRDGWGPVARQAAEAIERAFAKAPGVGR